MEPDRRFDGFRVAQQRPILACQRQHCLDMGEVVIVAVLCPIERGKLAFQRFVNQGFVFHGRLIFREPNPFDKALRKIEFTRAMIWLIEHVAQKCAAVLGQRHAEKQRLNAHRLNLFNRDAH
ncbi:hypothetical protein MESS2_350014 [Mesorhizobium metallidurans STM 2683]|uniref:Uncharacterized protein n=1 Tax=Mesorhizobium metallidurans STM 2683 TaxID=1297569 RepID=M5EQN4_9HYPH|nr:hypothetical protein MESS2_350014 [Mesorhizobium metallidurans STM 2683]